MPTLEQIREFKEAFGATAGQDSDLELTPSSNSKGNNEKLKATVEKLLNLLKKHMYTKYIAKDIDNATDPKGINDLVAEAQLLMDTDDNGTYGKLKAAYDLAMKAKDNLSLCSECKLLFVKEEQLWFKAKKDLGGGNPGVQAILQKLLEAKNLIELNNAADAKYATRFTKAKDILDKNPVNQLIPFVKNDLLPGWRNKVNKILEEGDEFKKAAKAYLNTGTLITDLTGSLSKAEAHLDKGEMKQALLEFDLLGEFYIAAKKLKARRVIYEQQLKKTNEEIEKIKDIYKKNPFDKFKIADQLRIAEDKASIDKRLIELAIDQLKYIEKLAIDVLSYKDDYISYLKTHANVVKNISGGKLKEIVDLLAEIKGISASDIDTTQSIKSSNEYKIYKAIDDAIKEVHSEKFMNRGIVKMDAKTVKAGKKFMEQIVKDIAAAKKYFESVDALKGFTDPDSLETSNADTAFGEIKKYYKIANEHEDNAAVIGTDKKLTVFKGKYGDTDELTELKAFVDNKDSSTDYKTKLSEAAKEIQEVLEIIYQQAGYKADLKMLTDRENTIKAEDNDTVVAKIKKPLDTFHDSISLFTEKHSENNWGERAKALSKAKDLADSAEDACSKRKKYNAELQKVKDRLRVVDPDDNTAVQTLLSAADVAADKLITSVTDDFKTAHQKLNEALIKTEELAVAKNVTGGNKAEIIESAKKLIESGNPKALDKLMKSSKLDVADATETFDILHEVFAKRFGLPKSDVAIAGTNPADQIKALKRIYNMMALVPDQVINNPSIKVITRVSPSDSPGGGYTMGSNEIEMEGRVGRLTGTDDSGNPFNDEEQFRKVGELPAIDPSSEYAPANTTKVHSFDIAVLHEVGHAVDDSVGFMMQNLKKAEYGNWEYHGGNIEPIAKLVAKKYGVENLFEEEIADLMRKKNIDWPAQDTLVDSKGSDITGIQAKILEIKVWYGKVKKSGGIWWNHQNCNDCKLGNERVYFEAYDDQWVSYPFSERAKGITGYQFRAPGEWFAELYAAYYVNPPKLKEAHPACKWLKKLEDVKYVQG